MIFSGRTSKFKTVLFLNSFDKPNSFGENNDLSCVIDISVPVDLHENYKSY